jgi:leucyl aminopeptidase
MCSRISFTGLVTILFVMGISIPTQAGDVYVLLKDMTHKKLIESKLINTIKIKQTKIKGTNIVLTLDNSQLHILSKQLHKVLHRCGGFRTFYSADELHRFEHKSNNKKLLSPLRLPLQEELNFTESETIINWYGQIERPRMNDFIQSLSSFPTRYYTSPSGIKAMEWIFNSWKKITKNRSDISIKKFIHKNFKQPSIILTIKGKNENETLVFGGHGDSINTDDGPTGKAPGADDNAAGIALLTELIQLIVNNNYAPKKNLTFMVYAAEEVGIIGSYEITRHYRNKNINVVGALQFDGVNYQGKSFEMALISDLTNPSQNRMLGALIDEYIQVPWTYQTCNFACSDHAAWNYEGYPVSYPAETIATEQNPHFHTARDTFDKSGFDTIHAEKFLKLAIAFLLERDRL